MSALLFAQADPIIRLAPIDWLILAVFIVFIIGMGFYLKRFARTDEDFFLAGRKNSAWVAGVAFMSANMGAMEVIGYTGMAVKYGMHCAHFYLISAVPAMLVLGLFMMPFYYSGRIKSIPGYLKERFDEKTRLFNAFIFSVMMVLVSGISLYLLALIMETVLGWPWHVSVWVAAALVALYVSLAGLISAIFTEVMQFFLIWAGILILPALGLIEVGPQEVWARLGELKAMPQTYAEVDPQVVATVDEQPTQTAEAGGYTSIWATTADPELNPMQVTFMGLILGIGFAIGFGYWTTDFLIIQRAFSARDLRSARLTPIIGSYFKILLGTVVICSGLVALTLMVKTEEERAGPHREPAGETFQPFVLLEDKAADLSGMGEEEIRVRAGHQLTVYKYQAEGQEPQYFFENLALYKGADGQDLYFDDGDGTRRRVQLQRVVLSGGDTAKVLAKNKINYDSAMPLLMARYFPCGLIGLGITAIIAMLMAGQAGNMSAFTAVWTYDLYRAVINKNASQKQLVRMGRIATVAGLVLAVVGAYIARGMPTVIDYLQAIASMILAPGVAVILPGMFIKRMTPHGAFWGMLVGFTASFAMFLVQQLDLVSYSFFTPVANAGFMAANFWRAVWAWIISFGVAMIVSFMTEPKDDASLRGLVWGHTDVKLQQHVAWYRTPWFWALVAFGIFIFLNVIFW